MPIENQSVEFKPVNPKASPAILKASIEAPLNKEKTETYEHIEFSLLDELSKDNEIEEDLINFMDLRVNDKPEEILSKPLTKLLNEEDFMKYETLSSIVNNILQTLDFNLLSRNSEIDSNIMKLLSVTTLSDEEILYESFSYNASLTNDEEYKLKTIINSFVKTLNEVSEKHFAKGA